MLASVKRRMYYTENDDRPAEPVESAEPTPVRSAADVFLFRAVVILFLAALILLLLGNLPQGDPPGAVFGLKLAVYVVAGFSLYRAYRKSTPTSAAGP